MCSNPLPSWTGCESGRCEVLSSDRDQAAAPKKWNNQNRILFNSFQFTSPFFCFQKFLDWNVLEFKQNLPTGFLQGPFFEASIRGGQTYGAVAMANAQLSFYASVARASSNREGQDDGPYSHDGSCRQADKVD